MQFYQTNFSVKQVENIDLKIFLNKLSASDSISDEINYLFFLNLQGRYVADIFFIPLLQYIIAPENILTNLILHLKKYDLKNQLKIKNIETFVYYSNVSQNNALKDPRDSTNHIILSNNQYKSDDIYYKQFRFNKKIAEFNDFELNKSIILNFGYIKKFISETKGCFPGQEAICFMKNQGVIKKTVDICPLTDQKIIRTLLIDKNLTLSYKYI